MKSFFERERRPGDFIFALLFLVFSAFLLSQIGSETKWIKGTKLFAQPPFWPAVGLAGMVLFATGHFLGSIYSRKSDGRGSEILLWCRSLEYAAWFMVYVWLVPKAGYLPTTIIFTLFLTYRTGYRKRLMFFSALLVAIAIVVVFKSLLSVKIPGAQLYEYLPDGIRNFMLLYL